MAKYMMMDLPRGKAESKRAKYPRMKRTHRITLEDLAHEISESSSFTKGDIVGAVELVADHIARRVAEGASVKIEGFGTFTAKLVLKEGAEHEQEGGSHRNAMSIEIGAINYRTDKGLLHAANRYCSLTRTKAQERGEVVAGREARLQLALEHLAEHPVMSVRTYADMTGLSPNEAGKELRKYRAEGVLGWVGRGTHLRYTLPTEVVD